MPTTSLASQLKSVAATYNNSSMEPFNAARLLFGDEGKGGPKDEDRLPTPDIKSYLKMTDPDDKFPTLSHTSGLVSCRFVHVRSLQINLILFSFLQTRTLWILPTPAHQSPGTLTTIAIALCHKVI